MSKGSCRSFCLHHRNRRILLFLWAVAVAEYVLVLENVLMFTVAEPLGETNTQLSEENDHPDQGGGALEATPTPKELLIFPRGVVDRFFQLFLRKTVNQSEQQYVGRPWWARDVESRRSQPRNSATPHFVPLKFFNVNRRVARVAVPGDTSHAEEEDEADKEGLVKIADPTIDENCYSGMTLNVYQRVDAEDFEGKDIVRDNACVAARNTATLVDTIQENPPRATSTVEIFERSYTLLEPVQLELGIVPRHYLDFAYNPVLGREEHHTAMDSESVNANEWDDVDEEVTPNADIVTRQKQGDQGQPPDPNIALEEQILGDLSTRTSDEQSVVFSSSFSAWWRWWFPHASTWWESRGSKESDFRMGKAPFAGGSHGEVWRGRRTCKQENERHAAFMRHHASSADEGMCDDLQPLVLKRLKVNRGFRLLEAGLREVYFGNLIQKDFEEQQKSLYTTYVDHFFREVPRRLFGQIQAAADLELWIVFEDAGPSLRSYLYTATMSEGFVMYQHSSLWTQLRTMPPFASGESFSDTNETFSERSRSIPSVGRNILRVVLYEILSAAAILHQKGIVHRDIKPSNIMCNGDAILKDIMSLDTMPSIQCRLGDFSSGWDPYTADHLYTKGPSPWEQTDEYAPPESYLGPSWIPFSRDKPESYDSWSVGVTILELLLGTPNVFTVDQRTNALLTHKMERAGASEDDISHALYLAALSQFCIYVPSQHNTSHPQTWPLRNGDPLHETAMAKDSCTLQDFHKALRARDPLGIGFDSSADLLLHLVWQLLAWDPNERVTAEGALQHPYFTNPDKSLKSLDVIPGHHNALESQMLDPRMDFDIEDSTHEFRCPKCGRVFHDWMSCHQHANSRKHAKFCTYDHSNLPTCLNAHSMLPEHPTSGYCDLQGRRPTIEDFHSIHLHFDHQFYGIFDGHTGNLASKFAASSMYKAIVDSVPGLFNADADPSIAEIERNVTIAFEQVHGRFLEAVNIMAIPVLQAGSGPSMDQSGTTATTLLVTNRTILVASLGDSRAVMSSLLTMDNETNSKWEYFPTMSAIQLTPDHVASDSSERDLVVSRGGTVTNSKGGIARVNGTLAITRSIGDALLSPVLSRQPHVLGMSRSEVHDACGIGLSKKYTHSIPCFVILASDGLWDTMSNQEAVDLVVNVILSSTGDASVAGGSVFQDAAEQLALEAYVRGSTDNIGVCVVAVE